MTYTNAIYYLDYELGSDTARADLVPSAYANNGSGLVRITVGSLGSPAVVTDAVVVIAGTTGNVYVGSWKITVINATTIDLQGSTYTSNPAAKGTCIPNGGGNWADAWKTITAGPTAARIAPGDTIRIAKSPVPVKLSGATGHATWTSLSKTVTLAEAQNATISLCEADWTPVNATSSAKLAVATDAKEGSFCVKVVEDGTPTNDQVQAYVATGALDLSGYQKISFWIKVEVALAVSKLELNLCSDAIGAVPVDTFQIPALPAGAWVPLTLARDGGGNLGNNINSINISNATAGYPTASKYIYLDDIIACTSTGLSLTSLISKNTLEQMTAADTNYGNEAWYPIQSINGTTVLLDNATSTKANAGRGYYTIGTSPETVDTYYRETIKCTMNTDNTTQDSGTAGNQITYTGGWDTGTSTQIGETIFDGQCGLATGFYVAGGYIDIDRISAVRWNNGVGNAGGASLHYHSVPLLAGITTLAGSFRPAVITIDEILCVVNNTATTISFQDNQVVTYVGMINNNLAKGLSIFSQNTFLYIGSVSNNGTYGTELNYDRTYIDELIDCNYNGTHGIYCTAVANRIRHITNLNDNPIAMYVTGAFFSIGKIDHLNDSSSYALQANEYAEALHINDITTSGNATVFQLARSAYIGKATISEVANIVTLAAAFRNCDRIYITSLNGYAYTKGLYYTIEQQDATAGGTGKEWKISPTNVAQDLYTPVVLPLARFKVNANKLVTVTCYFKKSHATDIGASLVCRYGQLTWSDADSDVITVCPSDTNRNQLQITFTPTEAGVIEIEAWTYWLANTADENVILDDMTIAQAT